MPDAFFLYLNYTFLLKETNKKLIAPHQILWDKIKSFELDDLGSDFSFSDRLAHENHWPLPFALMAMEEYKKFMFLIVIAPHALSPSEVVDKVWHLHLLYTESYWLHFCPEFLGKQVHHKPTRGGKAENEKFGDLYLKTKSFYLQIFGAEPNEITWPTPKELQTQPVLIN